MRILVISFFYFFLTIAWAEKLWVNMGDNPENFEQAIDRSQASSIGHQQLAEFQNRNMDQSLLLSKIEFWTKSKYLPGLIESEFSELQKRYVLSQNNRLILFEYFKTTNEVTSTSFKNLCLLYANDSYLKMSEPFFDSSCSFTRHSIYEINKKLADYDFMLIDGNKIDMKKSPYFFSSGGVHQFVFISNRFSTVELDGTTESLRKAKIEIKPWVEGECGDLRQTHLPKNLKAIVFFSEDCIVESKESSSSFGRFISKNKYLLLSGLILALAGSYMSSNYQLATSNQ